MEHNTADDPCEVIAPGPDPQLAQALKILESLVGDGGPPIDARDIEAALSSPASAPSEHLPLDEPEPEPQPEPPDDRPHPYRIPDCAATTRRGKQCGFAARRESGLCINHDPAYREQQRHNILKGARNSVRARYGPPPFALQLKNFDLSDRASILALLEAALALEFAGQLSAARCRNITRLLSLATRNLPNSAQLWSRTRADNQQARYRAVRANLAQLRLALLTPDTEDDTP